MDNNPPKIFLAIISCNKNASRVDILRETWLPLLSQYPYIEYKIFVGKHNLNSGFLPVEAPDVVQLDCPDDYDHLPQKMLAIFKHTYENYDFDYFFKCDDDNYFDPSLFDYKKDLLPYSGVGLLKYAFIPGAFYIHKRSTIKYFIDHGDEVPQTGPEDVIFTDMFKNLQSEFANFNCLVKSKDNDKFYQEVMYNSLTDIRKIFAISFYSIPGDPVLTQQNTVWAKHIHDIKTKYQFPKDSNYIIERWKLQHKGTDKIISLAKYSDVDFWWAPAFTAFGSVEEKDNKLTFSTDYCVHPKLENLKDEVFEYHKSDQVYESKNFILIKLGKPLTYVDHLWVQHGFGKDINMVGPSWEGTGKIGFSRIERSPVGAGDFEIIDTQSFNVVWDRYATEKYYYNEETRTAVSCPYHFELDRLKSPEYEYSDKDTVALFYNDYSEPISLESKVYLPYSYIATALMYLDRGYKVKLYSHQSIEEESSLNNQENFEIVDASTILIPPTNVLQTYKTFDIIFKLACICLNIDQVFINPGVISNKEKSLPYGFTKSLSYINLKTVDDVAKNAVDQLRQAFSSLASLQINEASDKVFIDGFIVPFIQQHMKDVNVLNFEIPVWSQHVLTRLNKHIDVVDKLIKTYPIMEIAPERFDLLENFDKISYGSYVGQYYLI